MEDARGPRPPARIMLRTVALLVAAVGAAPVLLAGLAAGLVERTPFAVIPGAITGAVVYWPLILLGMGALPLLLDPATERGRRLRRPSVVVLLLLVQLAWAVGNHLPVASRALAYYANARIDLHNLSEQLEFYFANEGSYTDDREALAYIQGDDRVIITLEVTPTGWTGTTGHTFDPEISCAAYGGEVRERPSTNRGHVPDRANQVICEPILPMGAFGAWLQRYHRYLDNNFLALI